MRFIMKGHLSKYRLFAIRHKGLFSVSRSKNQEPACLMRLIKKPSYIFILFNSFYTELYDIEVLNLRSFRIFANSTKQ